MADKLLRKAIAEKLGWREVRLGPDKQRFLTGKAPYDGQVHIIPTWDDNLGFAFDLLSGAEQENVGFSLSNLHYLEENRIAYLCTLFDPWGGPACEEYTAEAPTVPHAIAAAWLKWQEGQ